MVLVFLMGTIDLNGREQILEASIYSKLKLNIMIMAHVQGTTSLSSLQLAE